MAEKRIFDKMLEIGLGIAAYGEEKLSDFMNCWASNLLLISVKSMLRSR